jgi:hypothetical protein
MRSVFSFLELFMRFYLKLDVPETQALSTLAEKEYRDPRTQALRIAAQR